MLYLRHRDAGGELFAPAVGICIASSGQLTVVGNNNTRTISLALAGITAAGTYALSNDAPSRQVGVTSTSLTTQSWSSAMAGSSGSVTVSSITATRVSSTYTATLAGAIGTTSTMSVTKGVFDIGR